MSALICGSMAYDNIMVFNDRFKNHILPDKVHILNISFMVPELRREFGGCAGNIAYNLKLLGGEGYAMSTVGTDFGPYEHWMDEKGIDRRHVTEVEGTLTAQAFITTDLDDNQITAFHPGAMEYAHINRVADAKDDNITVGIVSPDGHDGMVEHATEFVEAGIPFIFDPGQGMPMFDADELKTFVDQATWISMNDYEWGLLQERTGYSVADIVAKTKALIVTRGGEGAGIYTGDAEIAIPVAPISEVKDPTGCGDAFRAGLLFGLMNELDWETTGRIASLLGAIKIEQHGTQNHEFDRAAFEARFKESFGRDI